MKRDTLLQHAKPAPTAKPLCKTGHVIWCYWTFASPDYNGIDLLTSIRQDNPDLQFIIMTGFSTLQTTVQAMKKGAFDYLAKPFSDDELTLSVNKALENVALKRDKPLCQCE